MTGSALADQRADALSATVLVLFIGEGINPTRDNRAAFTPALDKPPFAFGWKLANESKFSPLRPLRYSGDSHDG